MSCNDSWPESRCRKLQVKPTGMKERTVDIRVTRTFISRGESWASWTREENWECLNSKLRGSLHRRLRVDRSSQTHRIDRALDRRRRIIQCIRKLGEHIDVDGKVTEGSLNTCLRAGAKGGLCRDARESRTTVAVSFIVTICRWSSASLMVRRDSYKSLAKSKLFHQ